MNVEYSSVVGEFEARATFTHVENKTGFDVCLTINSTSFVRYYDVSYEFKFDYALVPAIIDVFVAIARNDDDVPCDCFKAVHALAYNAYNIQ